MRARQNLVQALEFNRHAQTLVSLTEAQRVTPEDIFLVLDLNEFQASLDSISLALVQHYPLLEKYREQR